MMLSNASGIFHILLLSYIDSIASLNLTVSLFQPTGLEDIGVNILLYPTCWHTFPHHFALAYSSSESNHFELFYRFYEEFKKSNETCLENFYRSYCPLITAEHYTCVGLSLELIKELSVLEQRYSGLIDRLFLVSCEECVDDVISYTSELPDPYDSDKEHVLVALKFNIAGRSGILLFDPGYHIGRAITIMKDCYYPHTGKYRFCFH